ncbi:MAG: hypothetical protein M1338_05445, partial [Patescibacteria group bacterium]|nr:hypothetical protein [Patescibacteria group bacterium]
ESEKGYYAESVANRDLDEPKTIIANLSKRLLAEANQSKYYGALASFLIQELNEKQILLYFNNPTLENITLAKNWGGKVAETRTDYLAVNNANLGGQKSSLNISQTLEFDAFINDKNEVIDNLKITRVHTGDGSWPDAENRNYMRILVPKGSRLLSAELDRADVTSAIETKDDSGKTSFCLWVNTPVGGTKILEISYELPFYLKNKKYYSLTLQKQPGELNSEAKVIVNDAVKFNDKLSTDQIVKF